MDNGNSTGYFNLQRGARQGNLLSAYLFILALEILFIQVRADFSIKGFRIKQLEMKVTAHTDDMTFFFSKALKLSEKL